MNRNDRNKDKDKHDKEKGTHNNYNTIKDHRNHGAQLNRNVTVLKAMAEFRSVRIQKKYLETDCIDTADIGIKQSIIESEVNYIANKVETIQKRMRDQDKKIDEILGLLKGEVEHRKAGQRSSDLSESTPSTGSLNEGRVVPLVPAINYMQRAASKRKALLDQME